MPVTALAATEVAAAAPSEPPYPKALSSPVNWESISRDVRRWVGLPPLPDSPFTFRPLPRPVSDAWIALRRIEYRFFNDYPTAAPSQSGQDSITGVVTGEMNGVDPDGDALGYTVVDKPDKGSVVINADGSYTYSPDLELAHAGGTDNFSVVVGDTPGNPWHVHGLLDLLGLTDPNTVAVEVNVRPIENKSPDVAAVITGPDPANDGSVKGTLGATDRNGDPLSYEVIKQPGKGTVALTPDGAYTFTPDRDKQHAAAADDATLADKTDTFSVAVTDPYGGITVSQVNVVIKSVNSEPTIDPEVTVYDTPTVFVSESRYSNGTRVTTSSITQILLIRPNARDLDPDELTITVTNAGTEPGEEKGEIQALEDGTYLYIPSENTVTKVGLGDNVTTDEITITVTDGHGGTTTETRTVTISNTLKIDGTLAIVNASGVGSSYINSSGQSIPIMGTVPIEGTPLTFGIDESGQNLVIDGGQTIKKLNIPISDKSGKPLGWNLQSDTFGDRVAVAVVRDDIDQKDPNVATSSLMAFVYLGPGKLIKT